MAAEGRFLELGCGDYSTPVLAAIARHKGVRHMVVTSDPDWGARYRDLTEVSVIARTAWADLGSMMTGRWGLVFIDNEQKSADRIRHLAWLAASDRSWHPGTRADQVVLHDAQNCIVLPHWPELSAPWPNITMHDRHRPATAVLRS